MATPKITRSIQINAELYWKLEKTAQSKEISVNALINQYLAAANKREEEKENGNDENGFTF